MRAGIVVAGRFELRAKIGVGGMGTVYLARDRTSGADVAIKLLDSDGSLNFARFRREGETLKRLSHPHIVRYVDHGESPAPYIAMQWVPGTTLAQRLASTGFDVGEAVRVMASLAGALAVAHRADIVHRDLKPSNIIFKRDDLARAVLIDFGVSRIVDGAALTRTGIAIGTPGYMAPEQARGERDVDGRADTFALGTVLYECATGRPAFAGANFAATLSKICLFHPDPLRVQCVEAPAALDALVHAMLAKAPTARPQMDEVKRALDKLAAGELPAGRRRPSTLALESPPTVRSDVRVPLLRCEILAGDPLAAGTSHVGAREVCDRMRARATTIELLRDGTIIVELVGDDPDLASRAADLALELQRALPSYVVTLTSSPDAGDAIDRGCSMLATELVQAMFARLGSASRRSVHVDLATASRLDKRFTVERTSEGALVHHVG